MLLAHLSILPHGAIPRSIAAGGAGHVALLLAPALTTHLAVAALAHAPMPPPPPPPTTTGLSIQRQGQGGQSHQSNPGKKNSLVHGAFTSGWGLLRDCEVLYEEPCVPGPFDLQPADRWRVLRPGGGVEQLAQLPLPDRKGVTRLIKGKENRNRDESVA